MLVVYVLFEFAHRNDGRDCLIDALNSGTAATQGCD